MRNVKKETYFGQFAKMGTIPVPKSSRISANGIAQLVLCDLQSNPEEKQEEEKKEESYDFTQDDANIAIKHLFQDTLLAQEQIWRNYLAQSVRLPILARNGSSSPVAASSTYR